MKTQTMIQMRLLQRTRRGVLPSHGFFLLFLVFDKTRFDADMPPTVVLISTKHETVLVKRMVKRQRKTKRNALDATNDLTGVKMSTDDAVFINGRVCKESSEETRVSTRIDRTTSGKTETL